MRDPRLFACHGSLFGGAPASRACPAASSRPRPRSAFPS
jgi:hypothetical protein